MTRKKTTKFDRRLANETYFPLARESTDNLDKRWYLYEKIAFHQMKCKFTKSEKELIHNICVDVKNNRGGDPLSWIAATFYAFFKYIKSMKVNREQFSNVFGVDANHMTQTSVKIWRDIYRKKYRDEYVENNSLIQDIYFRKNNRL